MPLKCYALVDGMALAYRSFYGVKQQLSTRDGIPTNALFGFIRAMDQLRECWHPTHWQVIFDGGIPDRRKLLVPEYKAQRKPMPEALRNQLEPIREYLDSAGISWLIVDKQEADDVLATLACQAVDQDANVLIATSDKDEFQMVNERISIISTGKDSEKMTAEDVIRKTGVRPDQIVDWLAMVGDAADNIPGVPGVGPVTASGWLQSFEHLEGIFAHLEEIKPVRFRQIMQDSKELLEKNRDMVKLDCHVDCQLDWSRTAVSRNVDSRLMAFYRKYELNSLLKGMAQPDLFSM